MFGFGFDIPQGDLGYQYKAEVHVIEEVRYAQLTPVFVSGKKGQSFFVTGNEKSGVVVFFDFDSSFLKESERKKLKSLKGKVYLRGHASPEGTEEYNLKLSHRRIRSVEEFLKKMGVEVLGKEPVGERECREPVLRWWMCRKVEVIDGGPPVTF